MLHVLDLIWFGCILAYPSGRRGVVTLVRSQIALTERTECGFGLVDFMYISQLQ